MISPEDIHMSVITQTEQVVASLSFKLTTLDDFSELESSNFVAVGHEAGTSGAQLL